MEKQQIPFILKALDADILFRLFLCASVFRFVSSRVSFNLSAIPQVPTLHHKRNERWTMLEIYFCSLYLRWGSRRRKQEKERERRGRGEGNRKDECQNVHHHVIACLNNEFEVVFALHFYNFIALAWFFFVHKLNLSHTLEYKKK